MMTERTEEKGFSLLDPNDANGDCKPDFTPSCHEVESNNGRDTFDFIELNGISWPQSDYEHMNPANEQSCKSSCLEDCFCAVAAYRDGECWKKRFPLSNGRKVASANVKSFLKFRKGDLPGTPPLLLGNYKDQRTLILVGSVLLGTCVSVVVVLTVAICVGFFVIYKKKVRNTYPSSKAIENNLPHFTYQELDKATNGFKDELGKGAFGIVYKGVIGKTMVAVKKLNRLVQDVFLFGDTRATWKERSYIAIGIAKGLAYLHEECSAQIIHCDLKPQNILLDENTPVTVKVDVYSFGVLLLEIISCRKSLVLESDYEGVSVLTDLAWDYYLEGRLDAFVEKDLEALDDYKNLTSFVMVGLWCIQENSSLRPTMRKVVQMLEGEIEVAEPPCPCPLSVTSC
ncbi:hypothetical protein L1887_18858 [Cichorium endivia]|nr:hypothetical protein L1887_18858 [Cichorium endivia]